MVNTEDFIKRLHSVLDYYDESASSFAEKVSVQRSSISHILSGRNKPSLDFILKTLVAFPSVDFYWLCNGEGNFPKTKEIKKQSSEFTNVNTAYSAPESNSKEMVNSQEDFPVPEIKKDKAIDRIVIFYADGSFKSYNNSV